VDRKGELKLNERAVVIGRRTWRVRHVEDQDALLALADGRDQFPFGLMLWESGVALATWLTEREDQLGGVTVLELGAGVGLPGIIAAGLGALVVQTDHDEQALDLARTNAELNGVSGIEVRLGDWFAWSDLTRYNLILGADIAYDGADLAAILELCKRVTARDGRVVLADPGREQQGALVRMARENGWYVERRDVRVGDLRSKVLGATLPIAILELTRLERGVPT
jgi:methyltransferase-like protein 23